LEHQERVDGFANLVPARPPSRGGPCLDRTIAPLPGRHRDDVAHGHRTPIHRGREPRPFRASVGDDLLDALDLPTGQLVLDVQVQADQPLREADRPVLVGRRLDGVRIDYVLMDERGIAARERVRTQTLGSLGSRYAHRSSGGRVRRRGSRRREQLLGGGARR
jgi:hypothetical protein